MFNPQPRGGSAARDLIKVLAGFTLFPLGLVILTESISYRSRTVQAQEISVEPAAGRVAQVPPAPQQIPAPLSKAANDRAKKGSQPSNSGAAQARYLTENYPVPDDITGKTPMEQRLWPLVSQSSGPPVTPANAGIDGYARIPSQTQWSLPKDHSSPSDPRLYEMLAKIRSVSVDDDEREATIVELKQELNSQFDEMHAGKQKEIDQFEERLQAMKQTQEKRLENKSQIVNRRAAQLLGEPDELSWEPAGVSVPFPGPIPYVHGSPTLTPQYDTRGNTRPVPTDRDATGPIRHGVTPPPFPSAPLQLPSQASAANSNDNFEPKDKSTE